MAFSSEETLDTWLTKAKQASVTSQSTWERVRMKLGEQGNEQGDSIFFDLAAYYNKNNPEHIETMLVLFDHTKQYGEDDEAISFVAVAIHELRTPLSMIRGYIEVFQEELDGKLTPELTDFMHKMDVSAQQLSTFINKILDFARLESDQLVVHLQEEQWDTVLGGILESLKLRAEVRGIELQAHIATGMPTAGIDRVSIFEVMSNLIDNAIKYSNKSTVVVVSSKLTDDGLIETTVQDSGIGIPESSMPNLFTKFYRSHRNRGRVGGTGLGLYLSDAIIKAHGGNIWVRSQEGHGSTFGFTLLPYSKLADAGKASDNKEIIRSAHSWIKNHSLYRR